MAGNINEYFRQRWKPCGKDIINVIQIDNLHKIQDQINEDSIIKSVINNVLSDLQKQRKQSSYLIKN